MAEELIVGSDSVLTPVSVDTNLALDTTETTLTAEPDSTIGT